MAEIQRIVISGFRGINTPPLELDFKKGNSFQSIMIYGRNGSGKSSIVDAWEWLSSGKVEHLAREGAGPQSYPHKEAGEGSTYIEAEFANSEIGKIKMQYDSKRITQPKIEGDITKLRKRIPHPCHLRYRDLTEFVYKRKAEKYEILSRFMGFANALDIQNDLQTCTGQLDQLSENLLNDRKRFFDEYQDISGQEPKDTASFIKIVNSVLTRHNISSAKELDELATKLKKLREKVEKDERSQKLSLWKEIQRIVDRFYPIEDISPIISEFQKDFTLFKRDEEEVSKYILLELYEVGLKSIEALKVYDKCPLCDHSYKGDLVQHIKNKHSSLYELSKKREELNKKKKALLLLVNKIRQKIEIALTNLEEKELEPPLIKFKENLVKLKSPFEDCKDTLEKKIENMAKDFDCSSKICTPEHKYFRDSEREIKDEILNQVKTLEEDKSRKLLVDDFQKIDRLQKAFTNWRWANNKIELFQKIKITFEEIRSNYVEDTKRSVKTSFDIISSDVVNYFKILEKDCDIIDDPKIKLISEKDKAVELEILFGGNLICPAYKILSESQLNSFGLSIFLSSIKNFNEDFKFIILDDVINSFDAYKRPRVIDLLKEYFSEYQILLLTHDSIWLDRLQRSFPHWIRKHFYGWEYTLGPRVEPGKNSYERIDELLSKDNPAEAGRTFGVYLEWILQLLCENLEALVKYNRRNEYTLFDLCQSFKERVKKKLGENHSVMKLLLDFESDTGFRNFCAHWKDPEVPYTSPEIREIVDKWLNIETKIECNKCNKFVKYERIDGHEHISCPCRQLDLKKDEYYS